MNELIVIIYWVFSTVEASFRSKHSDNCLLWKCFKIIKVISMLDPILSKSQSYMVSHRCVLKNSCCEVFEKISEKKHLWRCPF